ncbi:MAG: acyl-CoA--6-aminopenicillanic acid acyl-transferase [Clostridiales bacterium]|nr:acyl-CoA--6-aminopenicillanic acid acyl-transferase [Clostridiales bacterium]
MYHLRLKGNHYEMGLKRGRIFQRSGITFPLHLDAFQLEHGRRSEGILREIFPEVCEEVRGVSDAVGADYHSFMAWMLCMGCCMYNLEENIPVEVRGCTAFAWSVDHQVIYGRNNDLPPYLKKGCKSELYAPENGSRFQITTSSFINGEEGINEHGLAVAMTFVMTELEQIQAGLNSCFIVRYLLEKADSAEKAGQLLMELPVSSNCNILLADPEGKMMAVECTPDKKQIREALDLDRGRVLCIVNSFTSEEMKKYDAARGNDYGSRLRYGTVMNHFDRLIEGDWLEDAQKLLKGEYGFMCQYDDEPDFETVWSSVFDLKSRIIYRAEGDPRRKKFIKDSRLYDCMKK